MKSNKIKIKSQKNVVSKILERYAKIDETSKNLLASYGLACIIWLHDPTDENKKIVGNMAFNVAFDIARKIPYNESKLLQTKLIKA